VTSHFASSLFSKMLANYPPPLSHTDLRPFLKRQYAKGEWADASEISRGIDNGPGTEKQTKQIAKQVLVSLLVEFRSQLKMDKVLADNFTHILKDSYWTCFLTAQLWAEHMRKKSMLQNQNSIVDPSFAASLAPPDPGSSVHQYLVSCFVSQHQKRMGNQTPVNNVMRLLWSMMWMPLITNYARAVLATGLGRLGEGNRNNKRASLKLLSPATPEQSKGRLGTIRAMMGPSTPEDRPRRVNGARNGAAARELQIKAQQWQDQLGGTPEGGGDAVWNSWTNSSHRAAAAAVASKTNMFTQIGARNRASSKGFSMGGGMVQMGRRHSMGNVKDGYESTDSDDEEVVIMSSRRSSQTGASGGPRRPSSCDMAVKSPGFKAQMKKARTIFKQIDVDKSGALSFAELKVGLQRLGIEVDGDQVASLIRAFDVNGDGELDLTEFQQLVAAADLSDEKHKKAQENAVQCLSGGGGGGSVSGGAGGAGAGKRRGRSKKEKVLPRSQMRKVVKIFRQLDTDESGALSFAELKVGMRLLGIDLEDADLAKLMVDFDDNGDGELQLEEFKEMITAEVRKLEARAEAQSTYCSIAAVSFV
jgi:Ca2+-binding EF-hand superfamily protein